jgi:hypothetical protein
VSAIGSRTAAAGLRSFRAPMFSPPESLDRILGKQGVEIGHRNFLHFFIESLQSRALRSLMDSRVYPLFQLRFRQIKQAI